MTARASGFLWMSAAAPKRMEAVVDSLEFGLPRLARDGGDRILVWAE